MEHKNPWTTLSVKPIYNNPWISVEEHQVINPGGSQSVYGKVCFKHKALGIIPLDDKFNTVLVGQFRYTLNEYSWEIPMGGGMTGETHLEAAKRELKEETGLLARDWKQILKIHTSNSVTDEEGFVFVARGLRQSKSQRGTTERDLITRKLSLIEAQQMVFDGRITDSLSVAGLLMAGSLYLKD